MFQQLPVAVAVTCWGFDLGWGFDNKETRWLAFQTHLPGSTVGDHNVITGGERQAAKLAVQYALALMGEPDLVGLPVAVKIIHAAGRQADPQGDIAIPEEYPAGCNRIATRRHFDGLEGAMAQRSEAGILYG